MSVSLTAERPETLDLLRRNVELLAQELRHLGYVSVDISFTGQNAQEQSGEGGPQDPQTRQTQGDDTPQTAAIPAPHRLLLGNGVDLRL